MTEPDERGIDLAMMAFIGTRMGGGTHEEAERYAKALLELFGFKPESTQESHP